jgi:hypothetical protein
MNKLMVWVSIVIITIAMVSNCGCASYMVYKDSTAKVTMRKALVNNDITSIKHLKDGGEPSGTKIRSSFLEILMERPGLQLGALGVDGLLAYGAYEGIKAIDGGGEEKDGDQKFTMNNSQINGPVTIVGVKGDNNTTTTKINTGDGGEGTGEGGVGGGVGQ